MCEIRAVCLKARFDGPGFSRVKRFMVRAAVS